MPDKEALLTLAFSTDVIDVFRKLITPGYYLVQKFGDYSLEKRDAINHIVKIGWAYRYLEHFQIPGPYAGEEIWDTMIPASPLHRAWISWVTSKISPLPSQFQNMTLDEFWKMVISEFSLSALRDPPRVTISTAKAAFVKARFQNEFYRIAQECTNDHLMILPEYDTPSTFSSQGRMDFMVSPMNWGVEILCDGRDSWGHPQLSELGGANHPSIANISTTNYVVLDFRRDTPTVSHPGTCNVFLSMVW